MDGTWGTDGKAAEVWSTMLYLRAARPWEEGGKKRIASALKIGITPSSFLLVLTACLEGANREISPSQCFRPALADAVAPARVRGI